MKRTVLKGILLAVVLLAAFASCSSPVQGLWWDQPTEGDPGQKYWLTFGKDGDFEYVILSNAYTINKFYKGTYEVDKKAETITLTATSMTTGAIPESSAEDWEWTDTDETFEFKYAEEDGVLKVTLPDSTIVELAEREQVLQIEKSIEVEE